MERMTLEEQQVLQRKYNLLVERIGRMRGAQKSYFMYRSSSDLKKAQQLERIVDQQIADEIKEKQSQQQKLF